MIRLIPDPYGLDVHELADTKVREFAAVSGILHAAKWQTRILSDHAVDEDGACFDFVNEFCLFVRVVCPRSSAETKRGYIRDPDCFVDIGHPKEHCDWSKDLFA